MYLSRCLFAFISMCLSIYLPICLIISPRVSTYLPFFLSIYLSIYLSISTIFRLSRHPSRSLFSNRPYSLRILSLPLSSSSSPLLAHQVSCPTPGAAPDGAVVNPQNSYAVAETATYKCNNNNSTRDRICLSNGEWSPMGQVCSGEALFLNYMTVSLQPLVRCLTKKYILLVYLFLCLTRQPLALPSLIHTHSHTEIRT